MTPAGGTPNKKGGEVAKEERATVASEQSHSKPRRGAVEPRLPRGVLVRVDVFQDRDGRIRTFTLERLSGRWGDERSEVATQVVQTGLDILNRFADEDGRPEQPVVQPQAGTRIGKRGVLLDPDLQRLYG